jgi:DNA-binding MarR family transcriptional regulator
MVRKTTTKARNQRKAARKTGARGKNSTRRKNSAREKPGGKNPRRGRIAAPSLILPPPPGRGKRGEAGYLGYLLRQAQAASRLAMERALAPLGVTPPQFAVLIMLRVYPGLSGADLARVALLTPQTVGVIIRNLERDGAIAKSPHPVHGRVLQWALTRRGVARLQKCRQHVQSLERRLSAGLNARSEAAVRRWLSKIATDLQQG